MIGAYSEKEAEELARFFVSAIKTPIPVLYDSRYPMRNGYGMGIPQKKHFLQTRGLVLRIKDNGRTIKEFFKKPGEQSIGKLLVDIGKQIKKLDENQKLELFILHDFQKTNINLLDSNKGLYCNYITYSAYLLPENLDKIQYVERLCRKASLPDDAWQRDGFELFDFEIERFEFDVEHLI